MSKKSKNMRYAWVVWLFLLPFCTFAQRSEHRSSVGAFYAAEDHGRPVPVGVYSWEQFVDDYLLYASEQEEEGDNMVERYDWLEDLEEIHRSPIDINRAERCELEALHFLSDEQIDSLLAKRDRYSGGFRSLGELMSVRQLSYRERAWLSLLLKFEPLPYPSEGNNEERPGRRRLPPPDENRWYEGRHEWSALLDVPLYRRAGFGDYDADNFAAKKFTGQCVGHTLRYRYNWRQRVIYGATVQQDVGERFGAYGARPWDYGSAHFYFRSDTERYVRRRPSSGSSVENINRYEVAVGDYKLSMGQGLVVGNAGWNAREALLSGFRKETMRIRPNTGIDECRFLRGTAVNLRLGRVGQWQLTGYASWRRLDGTVKGMTKANDFAPLTSDTITAWKTDGLHRTLQEIAKRHTVSQSLVGGRAGYRGGWWNVGVNAAYVHYDKVYCPASRAYNKYYMRGRDAAAFSTDYSLNYGRWSLQGEVSLDQSAAYASTVALRWVPSTVLSVVLQERSFGKDFVSPYGSTLQSNSQLQNEHGVMLGFEYRGIHRFELTGFVNAALHPHPVYLADTLSHRYEAMLQGVCRSRGAWVHTLRYRLKGREQNVSGYKDIVGFDGVLMSWRTTQHLRWQSAWSRRRLSLTLGGDVAHYYSQGSSFVKQTNSIDGAGSSFGALAFVRTSLSLPQRWRIMALLTAFSTDNYNTRVYAYAPQLAGSASVPMFSGDGCCAVILAEGRLWRGFSIAVRYGVVKYFDRQSISSDVNRIASSWKNDLSVLLRYVL